MNKEQQELLDEAYKNYKTYMNNNIIETRWSKIEISEDGRSATGRHYTQEEFIDKCKTNPEFSENWGLKIKERELSLEERHKMALPIWREKYGLLADMMVPTNVDNTPYKIPTKQITLTYNDKTITSYE